MRILMLSALAVCAATPALADDARPPAFHSTSVVSENFLRQLDLDQLRLVRQATRTCSGRGRPVRPKNDPCVVIVTDQEIAESGNADLQDFHRALPQNDRYDQYRSSNVWRVWLRR